MHEQQQQHQTAEEKKEHLRKIARKVDLSIDRFDLDRFESIFMNVLCVYLCVCLVNITFCIIYFILVFDE